MYSRFARRLTTQLYHHHHHHHHHIFPSSTSTTTTTTFLRRIHNNTTFPKSYRVIPPWQPRFLSTRSARPSRGARPDIGARARQLQNRRLWTYALTFSCIAGFIVIVINQFQDQLVFYVTPTDALAKYTENPSKTKFRLGGLVLEGSVADTSSEIEFVITDLITDMLVRYQGSLPDLFREGHSVVVEGFIRPYTKESDQENDKAAKGEDSEGKQSAVANKAKSLTCYFKATEVLAKHDEKYMPPEVASAIEKNKKVLEEQQQQQKQDAEKAAVVDETTKG